jgi:hypothetical protein
VSVVCYVYVVTLSEHMHITIYDMTEHEYVIWALHLLDGKLRIRL